MKNHSATSCAAKIGIIFITFFGCSMCTCDVYFSNEYEFICVTEYYTNIAHYKNFYQTWITRCNGHEIQHSEIPVDGKTRLFRSIDCTWESYIFEKFGSEDIRFFLTGEQNPNSILQDYVFRGLCNVQKAVLRSANIHSIEPNAFDCITNIYDLDLSQNRIDVLPANFMKEMTSLLRLNLSYNSIETLEKGMFDNQQKLSELDLTGNKISILQDGIFFRLLNVGNLHLGKNDIKYLGHFPFSNMTQLKVLLLNENKLKSVENAFWRNSRLQLLDLSNNEIKSISKKVFSETKRLSVLSLSNNQLEQVTPEIFRDLQHLLILHLSFNQIVELKGEPFANNSELKELYLRGNKLAEIKGSDFRGLRKLHTLDLDSNWIENISIDSFKDMPGLQILNLNFNLLSALHTDVLNRSPFSNTAITILFLIDNVLKNISNAFHNASITHLYITNNTDLILDSDSFAGLTHLEILNMNNCNIISIPDGLFENKPQLNLISLQYNKIQAITPDAFASLNLSVLDLSFNNIEELTNHTFTACKRLLFLNASHNSISNIEQETFAGTYLIKLDLNSNFLTDIAFQAPDVIILNIDHNSLTDLDSVLNISQKLLFVDVSYNNLTNVTTEQWRKIAQLRVFSATGNYIQEVIIPEIDKFYALLNYKLGQNKIRRIHLPDNIERIQNESKSFPIPKFEGMDISVPFPTVIMSLRGNPIECDCSTYKVYDYLLNFNYTRDYVFFWDDLVCHNPLRLRGKKLVKMAPTDLMCDYKDYCNYYNCALPVFECLENCSCQYRPYGEFFTMNCSNNEFDSLPRYVPGHTTLLDMNFNSLNSLAQLNESLWENLTEFHAENNAIDSEVFDIPGNVEFLGLRNNRLRKFPDSIRAHANKASDFRVTLSGNLFQCDCSAVPLKEFLLTHKDQVDDIDEIECISSDDSLINMANLAYSDLCPREVETTISIAMYIVGAAIFMVLVAISLFYYNYKLYILALLYTNCNGCYRLLCYSQPIDTNRAFDGFIAHSSEDDEVAFGILQELEPQYKFCIHQRNWLPGTLITNNIIFSVQHSRKTLVVLSEKFLESKWFHLEFQAAFNQSLWDKTDRLVMIVKGKLPDSSQLPDNVKYVLKTKTYLEWGEKWFFEKLRHAMEEQKPFTIEMKSGGRFSSFFSRFQRRKTENQQEIELQA